MLGFARPGTPTQMRPEPPDHGRIERALRSDRVPVILERMFRVSGNILARLIV
jgi:hypothetical protein